MKPIPLPDGLAERWPSVQWGEPEWRAVLSIDDSLYFDLLDGIGAAGRGRRYIPVSRNAA